jgi:hypothetical protein
MFVLHIMSVNKCLCNNVIKRYYRSRPMLTLHMWTHRTAYSAPAPALLNICIGTPPADVVHIQNGITLQNYGIQHIFELKN